MNNNNNIQNASAGFRNFIGAFIGIMVVIGLINLATSDDAPESRPVNYPGALPPGVDWPSPPIYDPPSGESVESEPEPRYVRRRTCFGYGGQRRICKGDGHYNGNEWGYEWEPSSPMNVCDNCNGTGKCPRCNGTLYVSY